MIDMTWVRIVTLFAVLTLIVWHRQLGVLFGGLLFAAGLIAASLVVEWMR